MKTKASWRLDQRHLRVDVCPFWGARPASAIIRQDCIKLLFDNAARAPVGANRLKATRIINSLDDKAGASLKAARPTPHDLRRSAISGMSKIGVPRDDRMAVAAHSHGDVHEIYDKYERLRLALERWENHLRKVIGGAASGAEIINLRPGPR